MNKRKKVFLGMSGGVDSSLSAVLLKEQGYEVVGVYMKNWSQDLPGMRCPWADDLADAKRVAVQLGLDFRVFDFEKEYKQKVVDYMLAEFQAGRTPNPDIMCNQEIKFKLFYDVAREQGADLIATGHYAQIGGINSFSSDHKLGRSPLGTRTAALSASEEEAIYAPRTLMRATDENKDQTYFLYRISQDAINHTILPIGHLLKPEVKKLAAEHGLANAYKKESMGVCFVGEVGIKDFLREYIDVTPGPILDADTGARLGTHEGAVFYTVGQRHGLGIPSDLPYYLVRKDIPTNTLYVSKNLNHADLWTKELDLEDVVIRSGCRDVSSSDHKLGRAALSASEEEISRQDPPLMVRLRHRAPLIPATLSNNKLIFDKEVKRPASGQSAVFYQDRICLGGAIIK